MSEQTLEIVEAFGQGIEFEQERVVKLLNDELNDCQCETPLQHLKFNIQQIFDNSLGENK